MAERRPTLAQIEAAIEGAAHMPEAGIIGHAADAACPSESEGPDLVGIEPAEAIKRDTAVFEPGTHGRKPHAADDSSAPLKG